MDGLFGQQLFARLGPQEPQLALCVHLGGYGPDGDSGPGADDLDRGRGRRSFG